MSALYSRHRLPAVLAAISLIATYSLAATPQSAAPSAANPAPAAGAQPVDPAAASYSLGLSFATQWREGGLDGLIKEDEMLRGIRAGLEGGKLTDEDRQRASAFLQKAYEGWAARNKTAAADFLARNAKEPEVKTTASGLQYRILAKGDGTAPATSANDRVTVQYRGHLLDGREFDSSYARGQPAVIKPSVVIAGWREALAMMSRGSQWRLFVPPDLAYGTTPPPSIPPNSLLVFDVEVLGIDHLSEPRAAVAPAH